MGLRWIILGYLFLLTETVCLGAQNPPNPPEASSAHPEVFLEEGQLIRLNQSLKNAIEENSDLKDENARMEAELKEIHAQGNLQLEKTQALTQKTDQLEKKIQDLTDLNTQQSQQTQELKTILEQKSRESDQRNNQWQQKIKALEDHLALEYKERSLAGALLQQSPVPAQVLRPNRAAPLKTQPVSKTPPVAGVPPQLPADAKELLAKVDEIHGHNEQLKKDSARVHYNLGNLFLKRGDYKKALSEYEEAVTLTPGDAFSHYQIALLSDEFLNSPKQALFHYERYLQLNPQSPDAALIQEKIKNVKRRLQGKK